MPTSNISDEESQASLVSVPENLAKFSDAFRNHLKECSEAWTSSLETLCVVSTLLAGFAISEMADFDPETWPEPITMYAYVVCEISVLCITLYISFVSALGIMVIKRVSSWDSGMETKSAEEIYNNGKFHWNYACTMRWVYGDDKSQWLDRGTPGTTFVKLPLVHMVFCDGVMPMLSYGLRLLPLTLLLHCATLALSVTRHLKSIPMIMVLASLLFLVGVVFFRIASGVVRVILS